MFKFLRANRRSQKGPMWLLDLGFLLKSKVQTSMNFRQLKVSCLMNRKLRLCASTAYWGNLGMFNAKNVINLNSSLQTKRHLLMFQKKNCFRTISLTKLWLSLGQSSPVVSHHFAYQKKFCSLLVLFFWSNLIQNFTFSQTKGILVCHF